MCVSKKGRKGNVVNVTPKLYGVSPNWNYFRQAKEYPVKVGDLIKCGDEFATILAITKQPDSDTFWLDCLWENGEEEGIDSDEVEAVNESH
jgi:hypothetical protein